VPLKSTGHRNTAGPEKVEEELMTMARAQEQQRRATVKVSRKSGASFFLVPYYLFAERSNPKKGRNEKANSYLVVLFFFTD
jgi:hypothetical protein